MKKPILALVSLSIALAHAGASASDAILPIEQFDMSQIHGIWKLVNPAPNGNRMVDGADCFYYLKLGRGESPNALGGHNTYGGYPLSRLINETWLNDVLNPQTVLVHSGKSGDYSRGAALVAEYSRWVDSTEVGYRAPHEGETTALTHVTESYDFLPGGGLVIAKEERSTLLDGKGMRAFPQADSLGTCRYQLMTEDELARVASTEGDARSAKSVPEKGASASPQARSAVATSARSTQ